MSDGSKIEWCEATWNPVTGCTKVSPGCDHCYAERVTERFHGKGSFANVVLHPDRLDQPLRWRRSRKVFVNSMSDLFHDDVPDEYIARVFAVMAVTPRHTYQLLTKRHGRMRALLGSMAFRQLVLGFARELQRDHPKKAPVVPTYIDGGGLAQLVWPLSNVWLGVSVESQRWADIRIPALLETPAAVRFLSCEPLLGAVMLRDEWMWQTRGVHWVIVGGESGAGARPMHPAWVRTLRDQCAAAGGGAGSRVNESGAHEETRQAGPPPVRSAALQALLDDLTAERQAPVPPAPSRAPDHAWLRLRTLAEEAALHDEQEPTRRCPRCHTDQPLTVYGPGDTCTHCTQRTAPHREAAS